jgi:hypothetical protein
MQAGLPEVRLLHELLGLLLRMFHSPLTPLERERFEELLGCLIRPE